LAGRAKMRISRYKSAGCALLLGLGVAACASIVEGSNQEIFVSVTPENAVCNAAQRGKEVARYNPARMSITVPKSRNDLFITCVSPGYKNKFVHIVSEASAWGVVGALTLDFGVVDYSTGALNKYPGSLTIVMEREETAAR